MPTTPSRRNKKNAQLHALLSGASTGCTAFLIGALVIGIALVAMSLRGG